MLCFAASHLLFCFRGFLMLGCILSLRFAVLLRLGGSLQLGSKLRFGDSLQLGSSAVRDIPGDLFDPQPNQSH